MCYIWSLVSMHVNAHPFNAYTHIIACFTVLYISWSCRESLIPVFNLGFRWSDDEAPLGEFTFTVMGVDAHSPSDNDPCRLVGEDMLHIARQ